MPNSPGRSASERSRSPGHRFSGSYNMNSQDPSVVKGSRQESPFPVSGSQSADYILKDNKLIANNVTLRSGLTGRSKRETSPVSLSSSNSGPLMSQKQQFNEHVQVEQVEQPGPISLDLNTGSRIEFSFGIATFIVFMSLWIYIMYANCYNSLEKVFYLKTMPMIGALTGLFIAVYNYFERTITPRVGIAGCCFLVFIGLVGSLNLVGAFLASSCPCRCTGSPFKSPGADLIIMVLEIFGSLCLLATLLVTMMTRLN